MTIAEGLKMGLRGSESGEKTARGSGGSRVKQTVLVELEEQSEPDLLPSLNSCRSSPSVEFLGPFLTLSTSLSHWPPSTLLSTRGTDPTLSCPLALCRPSAPPERGS